MDYICSQMKLSMEVRLGWLPSMEENFLLRQQHCLVRKQQQWVTGNLIDYIKA